MPTAPPPLPTARPTPAFVALVAAALALATRLPYLPQQLHDHDSVNFAHALHNFDLSRHSPHLPGYPLYVVLGRLAQALGASDAAALAWPAVLGAVVASAAVGLWLTKIAGPFWALAGVALYLCLPDLWLADARPLSDGMGAHLVTLTVLLAMASAQGDFLGSQRLLGRAAVLAAGALLAVRLSSWPVALGTLLWMAVASADRQERWIRAGLFATVTLAWLLPLTWLAEGPLALFKLGAAFAQGHAMQWRGDGPPLSGLGAAQLWLAHLWNGGAGLLALGLAAALVSGRHHWQDRAGATWLLALALGYVLWMVVGQNPERPRHILPLVALLAVALFAVTGRRLAGQFRSILLALSLVIAGAAVTVPRLSLQQAQPSPDVALGLWLARQPAEGMLVLGGSEVGVLRWQAPAARSLRVANAADLRAMLGDPSALAPRLYASSRVPGLADVEQTALRLTEVATFEARPGVDLPQQTLTLYRLQPHGYVAKAQSRGKEQP